MRLLGGWEWYLPKRLAWIPQLHHGLICFAVIGNS